MRSTSRSSSRKKRPFVASLLVAVVAFASLALVIADASQAREVKESHQKPKPTAVKPSATKLTKEAAVEIALKKVPGTVTAVDSEKKSGRDVYAVEIIAADGGKETDVFVDKATGEVIATD